MRDFIQRLPALLLATWGAALLSPPADARLISSDPEKGVHAVHTRAALLFSAGWEDLILGVEYEGAAREFTWVIALPSMPEIDFAEPWIFDVLGAVTATPNLGRSAIGASAARPPADAGRDERYGPITAQIRAASVLDKNSSSVRVVMHVTASDTSRAMGALPPIRLRFRTPEPVLPQDEEPGAWLLYAVADPPLCSAREGDSIWEWRLCGPLSPALVRDLDIPGTHPALSEGRGSLTRLTTSRGGTPQGTRFAVYAPRPWLGSPNEDERAQAVSYLGWNRVREAAPALAALLEDRDRAGEDVLSALWALGECGDRAAIPVLRRWAAHADSRVRIEAFDALGRLGATDHLPICLQTIARDEPRCADEEFRVCIDQLVSRGDSTLIPRLRGRTDELGGFQAWRAFGQRWPRDDETHQRAIACVAALAACGDSAASGAIVAALVAEGMELASPSALERRAGDEGSMSEFPRGFWNGAAILHRRGLADGWVTLATMYDLLRGRPAIRDQILRAAAQDARLPDAARVILLADLSAPREEDFTGLRRIWNDALAAGQICSVRVPLAGERRDTLVAYNINACAAAYAQARLGNVGGLAALLGSCPPDDPTLRAEVVHAIAWSGTPEGAPLVAAYVRDVWNANAARSAVAPPPGDSCSEGGSAGQTVVWGLDLPYRVRALTSYLFSEVADHALVSGLMTDSALDPYLRLHWLASVPDRRSELRDLRQAARAALNSMEVLDRPDRPIKELIALCRCRLGGAPFPLGE